MAKSSEIKQNRVEMVEISSDLAGQRIDNFLLAKLRGVPRALVYRILRKGEVRVNKGRIKPSYRLQAGDTVRIPPVRTPAPGEPPIVGQELVRRIEQAVLYEDARFLVLNKPSGLAVHGGSGIRLGVIELLRAARPDAPYLELVHRLDRDTSGCLLIAKKRSALRALHGLLRENQVDKRYLVLLRGPWPTKRTWVELPLRKNMLSSGERLVRVAEDGKPALSEFLPRNIDSLASLAEVSLHTGRTHQIRVHAASSGHPVAGDEKYGDEAFNRQMQAHGLKRMFLHAWKLAFTLPDTGDALEFTAPLDDDLLATLTQLGIDGWNVKND